MRWVENHENLEHVCLSFGLVFWTVSCLLLGNLFVVLKQFPCTKQVLEVFSCLFGCLVVSVVGFPKRYRFAVCGTAKILCRWPLFLDLWGLGVWRPCPLLQKINRFIIEARQGGPKSLQLFEIFRRLWRFPFVSPKSFGVCKIDGTWSSWKTTEKWLGFCLVGFGIYSQPLCSADGFKHLTWLPLSQGNRYEMEAKRWCPGMGNITEQLLLLKLHGIHDWTRYGLNQNSNQTLIFNVDFMKLEWAHKPFHLRTPMAFSFLNPLAGSFASVFAHSHLRWLLIPALLDRPDGMDLQETSWSEIPSENKAIMVTTWFFRSRSDSEVPRISRIHLQFLPGAHSTLWVDSSYLGQHLGTGGVSCLGVFLLLKKRHSQMWCGVLLFFLWLRIPYINDILWHETERKWGTNGSLIYEFFYAANFQLWFDFLASCSDQPPDISFSGQVIQKILHFFITLSHSSMNKALQNKL